MVLFVWTPQLDTGIASIDDQHHRLVDILNGIHDALSRGKGKQHVGDALVELADYAATHFAFEEGLLFRAGYAEATRHRAVHAAMEAHVADLRTRFEEGRATTVEVLTFVSDWLKKHILETDQRYAPFVKAKGAV